MTFHLSLARKREAEIRREREAAAAIAIEAQRAVTTKIGTVRSTKARAESIAPMIVCRIFGHRWSEFFDLEACPLAYRRCRRCGWIRHYCNEIDWSAAIAIEAQRAVTTKIGTVRSTKARAESIAQTPVPSSRERK